MPYLATYVGLLHRGERSLADSLQLVAEGHATHPDVVVTCRLLASACKQHEAELQPIAQRYGEEQETAPQQPERLDAEGLTSTRGGQVGLLRDLQDLHTLATFLQTSWVATRQAALALRDTELVALADRALADRERELAWLTTHLKVTAPQALVVAP